MTKIFISWSKSLSRDLAIETKNFLENVLSNSIAFFLSPDMYKGTCVDQEIHKNLLTCDKCIVCITSDNFKNPWLLYESGIVYGANYHHKTNKSIIVPILFENIPEWSSWIDKPLNRYAPIQIKNINNEFSSGKNDFKKFIDQLSDEYHIPINKFEFNWKKFESKVQQILTKNQSIPTECQGIVYKLMEDNTFTINNPEISKEKICFHKGFTTNALTKILTDNISLYHGKYLWLYGRKNYNLITLSEYNSFFEYLATEGLKNGVDFRCFFVHPKSEAAIKASSQERIDYFDDEMKTILKMAYSLKNKFDLPVEEIFRLYKEPRIESITRIDNAVLYRNIIKDSNGYPIPYTNSGFEILSALENETNNSKGARLIEKFDTIWNDNEKSVALTKELLNELYG